MDPITLKGRSDSFGDSVLVWENQVVLFLSTPNATFTWQVQDGPITEFTVQSLLQALIKKQFKRQNRSKDEKPFLIFDSKLLVKV